MLCLRIVIGNASRRQKGSTPCGPSRYCVLPGTAGNPMNPDFRDLLAEFNAHNVDYLIVGAHALAAHGHIRATKDLDVWVRAEPDNARKVLRALKAFGAPLQDLTENDLTQPGLIFQIGVPPVRIDVVTSIDGVSFSEAWPARVQTAFSGQPV